MIQIKNTIKLFVIVNLIFFGLNLVNNNIVSAATLVNINTADAIELDTIPEVGPSTAAKIIAYREVNGLFLIIEDIMKVSGIKEATFDKMKDFITVGDDTSDDDGGIATTTATTTDNVATSTATTTEIVTTNYRIISVHYYQEEISDYVESTNVFEISAGRDRLTYVGSPINLEAKFKTSNDLKNKQDFIWSFGDGSTGTGDTQVHIYKYAGEYNVVLNGTAGEIHAVARNKIKVLVPNLALNILPDEALEITNQGPVEINLYNWKLSDGQTDYLFPLDTIISAGQNIIIPVEYTKLSGVGGPITLVNFVGQIVAETRHKSLVEVNEENTISLEEWNTFALNYKATQAIKSNLVVVVSASVPIEQSKEIKVPEKASAIPLTASVASAFISTSSNALSNSKSRGFWDKIWHPIQIIQETFYQ